MYRHHRKEDSQMKKNYILLVIREILIKTIKYNNNKNVNYQD